MASLCLKWVQYISYYFVDIKLVDGLVLSVLWLQGWGQLRSWSWVQFQLQLWSWNWSWNLWNWSWCWSWYSGNFPELELELKLPELELELELKLSGVGVGVEILSTFLLFMYYLKHMTLKTGSITWLCLITRQSVLQSLPFLKFWSIRIMISLILFKQYKVRSFVHLDHRGIVLRFQTETERVCMS